MLLSPSMLLAVSGIATASSLLPRQQLCNGHAEFCNRIYSNVSWIGTHNAPFVGTILDPRVNQEKTVTEQLDAGIRFLTGQTHVFLNDTPLAELHMCHTSCALLDSGSLTNFLSSVKTWVDGNPDEVVTLLLTNGDRVDVSEFDAAFKSTGLDQLAFVPSTNPNMLQIGDWPTYGELIGCGKRVVVFLDYLADVTKVPYILDEFTYFFETPFTQTDPSSLEQCKIDRPPGASPDGRMYLVNHVLDENFLGDPDIQVPDNNADMTTNAATGNGSIGDQAGICTGIYGRVPNTLIVDFFDRGDVFTAQNTLNGVS